MDSQQTISWFEIARRVDTLLGKSAAKERFIEQVRKAASEWLQRGDDRRKREQDRREAVKKSGVPYGADHLPLDHEVGAFHCVIDFHDGESPLEAWLPANLSPEWDPDDSLPLPVPADRAVSLVEKYAVLAAIWDTHWQGDTKINPWLTDEFCREAIFYANLLRALRPDDVDAALSVNDAVVVQTWIADVAADLPDDVLVATGPSTSKCKRRGRKKADFDTQIREAAFAADWQRAREAGVLKADFVKPKNMTVRELDSLLDRVAARKSASE